MAHSRPQDIVRALPGVTPRCVVIAAAGAAVVLAMAAFAKLTDVTINDLVRDPLAVAEAPLYYGALSNLGVLLWAGAASVALLAGAVLRADGPASPDWPGFLLATGGLSAVLGLDDLFMFHEIIAPGYLNIPELAVFSAYGLAVLAVLFYWRAEVARSPHGILTLAAVAFAVSVVTDLLNHELKPFVSLLEDGAKFMGVLLWCTYLGATAYQRVRAG